MEFKYLFDFKANTEEAKRKIGDMEEQIKKFVKVKDKLTGEEVFKERTFTKAAQSMELADGKVRQLSQTTETFAKNLEKKNQVLNQSVKTTDNFNKVFRRLGETIKTVDGQTITTTKSFNKLGDQVGIVTNIKKGFIKQIDQTALKLKEEAKAEKERNAVVGHNINVEKLRGGSLIKTTQSLNAQGQVVKTLTNTTKGLTSSKNDLTSSLIKLTQRAIFVIPIWLALRSAYMLFIRTIIDAKKHLIDTDEALARARSVSSELGEDLGEGMMLLKKRAEEYAVSHKGSAKDVIDAYYHMQSAGNDFISSLEGSIPIVNLAKGTYTDVAETARIVSSVYRLFGEEITDVSSEQEKMVKIVNIMSRAWDSHQVELNQLREAYAVSAGTAKSFGLNLTELTAVLAVSHDNLISGGKAGTLFSMSLNEISEKLPQVIETLGKAKFEKIIGKAFDPKAIMEWFKILMGLIKHFRDLGKSTFETEQAMTAIFGDRSKRQIRIFIDQFEEIEKTVVDLGDKSGITAEKLAKIAGHTLTAQLENLHENFNVLFASFVTGATQTEDLITGLENINKSLSDMTVLTAAAGGGFSQLLINLRSVWRVVIGLKREIEAISEDFSTETAMGMIKFSTFGLLSKEKENEIRKQLESQRRYPQKPKGFGRIFDEATVGVKTVEQAQNEAAQRAIDNYEKLLEQLRQKAKGKKGKKGETPEEENKETQEEINLAMKDQLLSLDRLKTMGYSILEIEIARYRLLKEKFPEATKELLEQQRKVLQVYQEEIIKASELLRTSFQSALEGVFKGEIGFKEFASKIGTTIRDAQISALSEAVTGKVFEMTGIGEMFGLNIAGLKNVFNKSGNVITDAHIQGAIAAAKMFEDALISGATKGSAILSGKAANLPGIGSPMGGAFGGFGAGLPGFGPGGMFGTNTPMGTTPGGKPIFRNPKTGQISGFPGWGGIIGLGGSVVSSSIMGSQSGGMAGGIMGGLGGAATGLAGMGMMAPLLGPLGAIFTIGSLISGMFGKTPKFRREEVREETKLVSSKIDVTNKHLEFVNRNLVALRNEITFILPKSSYFAQNTVADNFSLSSHRGAQ